MNPFADLLKDEVYIVLQNGVRKGPYKTNLRNGRATLFEKNLEVNQGDSLVHPRLDGQEEVYTIEDCQYAERMLDVPESFTLLLSEHSTLATPEKNIPSKNQSKDTANSALQDIFKNLIRDIDSSENTIKDKIIAKHKIKELLSNPTIADILGTDAVELLKLP